MRHQIRLSKPKKQSKVLGARLEKENDWVASFSERYKLIPQYQSFIDEGTSSPHIRPRLKTILEGIKDKVDNPDDKDDTEILEHLPEQFSVWQAQVATLPTKAEQAEELKRQIGHLEQALQDVDPIEIKTKKGIQIKTVLYKKMADLYNDLDSLQSTSTQSHSVSDVGDRVSRPTEQPRPTAQQLAQQEETQAIQFIRQQTDHNIAGYDLTSEHLEEVARFARSEGQRLNSGVLDSIADSLETQATEKRKSELLAQLDNILTNPRNELTAGQFRDLADQAIDFSKEFKDDPDFLAKAALLESKAEQLDLLSPQPVPRVADSFNRSGIPNLNLRETTSSSIPTLTPSPRVSLPEPTIPSSNRPVISDDASKQKLEKMYDALAKLAQENPHNQSIQRAFQKAGRTMRKVDQQTVDADTAFNEISVAISNTGITFQDTQSDITETPEQQGSGGYNRPDVFASSSTPIVRTGGDGNDFTGGVGKEIERQTNQNNKNGKKTPPPESLDD